MSLKTSNKNRKPSTKTSAKSTKKTKVDQNIDAKPINITPFSNVPKKYIIIASVILITILLLV